jgi:hypothetical protein
VIAANYFNDTPLIVYTYDNDLVHDFENQLVYRNFFKVTDFDNNAGKGMRLGIEFQTTDWEAPENHTGKNIDIAENTFDVDPQSRESDVPVNLHRGETTSDGWRVYPSNTYLDSGNTVVLTGLSGPYSITAGGPSPSTWSLSKYDAMMVPDLNIPPFGTDPVNMPPAFTSNPIVEPNAVVDLVYGSSIADDAADAENDPLTFSKLSGPTWLIVSTSGALSGEPRASDVGPNMWTVEVSDGTAATNATLQITVAAEGTNHFNPTEDTFVKQVDPTTPFGDATAMNLRESDTKQMDGYLKFNVQGIRGSVISARLKLYTLHTHTLSVRAVSDTSWDEDALTWSNRPSVGSLLASMAVSANTLVTMDLPEGTIPGNGNYSFALQTDTANFRQISTKEAEVNIPILEVTVVGGTATNTAPAFTSNPIVETNAVMGLVYGSSIADDVADAEGDPLTFSKLTGPAWLTVATNGILSGQPEATNVGVNNWTVQVSDGAESTNATLQIAVDSNGDWDGDGLPDAWELQYFGHPTNAVSSNDSDGDGSTDKAEFISGFNPTNPASYFSITGFERPAGSSNLVLHWPAVEGRLYHALWANSLTGDFSTIVSNMPHPRTSCTVNVNQAESAGLYKVEVKFPEAP